MLVLAILSAFAGCSAAVVTPVGSGGSPYQGAYLDTPYQLPQATLTGTDGKDFDLRTGSDKPVLVLYFGYTNCPDICLGQLTDIATALNRVDADVREKIQVIFITVDPDRDTPEVIRDYLARIDPDFVGLTAPLPTVKAVGAAMGVVVEGTTPTGDGYDVTHSDQVIAFDSGRLGRLVWTQGTSIGTLRSDFTQFVRQQP